MWSWLSSPNFANPIWQTLVFWLWAAVAMGGGVAVICSFTSAIVQYYISDTTEKEARKDINESKEKIVQAEAKIRDADARIAEANARAVQAEADAAKANLQLAFIRTPRQLTPEVRASVIQAAGRSPGTVFESAIRPSDSEAYGFFQQMEAALIEGGWVERDWSGPTALVMQRDGKPSAGTFFGDGAGLAYQQGADPKLIEAVTAVSEALQLMPARPEDFVRGPRLIGDATDCVRLLVGAKIVP